MIKKENIYCAKEQNKIMRENLLGISTDCFISFGGGSTCWSFHLHVLQMDKESDNDPQSIMVMNGILIPSDNEHEYSSQHMTCAAISGELHYAIAQLTDPKKGSLAPDLLKEFELSGSERDLQFCYVGDMVPNSIADLDMSLEIFPSIMNAMPGFKKGVVLMLLTSDKEKEYIPIFLENGWKVHCPDEGENCYSVYKGFSVFE